MNIFFKFYGNLKFRNKINITYSLISLIPILFLGIFCYFQTKSLLIKQEEANLETTISQISTNIDYALETYTNASNYVTYNSGIQSALQDDYKNNYYAMGQVYDNLIDPIIFSLKYLYPSIKQLTLYTNTNMSQHGNILKNLNSIYEKNWYNSVISDYNIHWFIDEDNTLSCIRRMPNLRYFKSPKHTIVYLNVDSEGIFRTLETSLGNNYGLVIINSKNEIIYSKDFFDKNYSYLKLSDNQIFEFNQNSSNSKLLKNYAIKSSSLKNSDWKIIIYRPITFISKSISSIIYTILIVIAICGIILFFTGILLSKLIVSPLIKLTKSMNEVKNGNLNIQISSPYTDELGIMTNTFQNMLIQIDTLFKEIYENKIQQQKLKLKALQAQINPHFLYNSLSLINWKAIIAEQHEISKMSQLLSTFYRTSLNKGKNSTSIKDEIENTKSYIEIQLMLHNNKFKVEYNLDETIYNFSILNLTLQPLVENSIIHGLDLKESGEKILIVSASFIEESNLIEVCIQDNGVGINDNILPHLLNIHSKGYGLKNVNDRIKLYFGDSFGLEIQSKEGIGTKITAKIPAIPIDPDMKN